MASNKPESDVTDAKAPQEATAIKKNKPEKKGSNRTASKKSAPGNGSLDVDAALTRSEAYFIKHKEPIIGIVVGIIVVVGLFFFLRSQVRTNEQKAQTYLTQGAALMAQKDYDKALNGESKYPGYLKIIKNYSSIVPFMSTDASNIAKMCAGLCYAKKGDTKKAIKYLEDFKPQGDKTLSAQGLAALANCYASNKQLDKAVSTFKKAADQADNDALSPLYLLEAGKILESQKKKSEALKLYTQIKEDYPGCFYSALQPTSDGSLGAPLIDRYIERVSK